MKILRFVAAVCLSTSTGVFAFGLSHLVPMVSVVEFHNRFLDHYFLTADPAEIAAIEAGAAGPGWQRTGFGLSAWGLNDLGQSCAGFSGSSWAVCVGRGESGIWSAGAGTGGPSAALRFLPNSSGSRSPGRLANGAHAAAANTQTAPIHVRRDNMPESILSGLNEGPTDGGE